MSHYSIAVGTYAHAGVDSEEEAKWASSIHRLIDLGVLEEHTWLFQRVATSLRRLPHQVLADVGNNMAQHHATDILNIAQHKRAS